MMKLYNIPMYKAVFHIIFLNILYIVCSVNGGCLRCKVLVRVIWDRVIPYYPHICHFTHICKFGCQIILIDLYVNIFIIKQLIYIAIILKDMLLYNKLIIIEI